VAKDVIISGFMINKMQNEFFYEFHLAIIYLAFFTTTKFPDYPINVDDEWPSQRFVWKE
jgi:hypothetical protein